LQESRAASSRVQAERDKWPGLAYIARKLRIRGPTC
jgi:hypothetical protein